MQIITHRLLAQQLILHHTTETQNLVKTALSLKLFIEQGFNFIGYIETYGHE